MKYIVKNEENKLMIMDVVSFIPQLPEGFEILGSESEVNPNGLELEKCTIADGILVEDSNKILEIRQTSANINLKAVRDLRNSLLIEADHKINTLEDDNQDATAWRVYRKLLRECTDSYKKTNGDAKLSCENLEASKFEFPAKPS